MRIWFSNASLWCTYNLHAAAVSHDFLNPHLSTLTLGIETAPLCFATALLPLSQLLPSCNFRMASITASIPAASVARAALVHKGATGVSAPVLGLPQMRMRGGRATCSSERPNANANAAAPAGMGAASMLAAVSVMSASYPAFALVDERMSTEGTGLGLGLSNNLLGWILLGVFALIWSLYSVYTSTLEEDEESGLSL